MKLALKKGVRAFMLDLHMMSAHELGLCHYSCAFGSISLDKTFQMFRDFLHFNPREVITIIWEVVCIDSCEKSVMYTIWVNKLKESELFPQLLVQKQGQHPWPTLEEMITNQTRLVSFSDFGHDLNFWDLRFDMFTVENTYESVTLHDLKKPCTLLNSYEIWTSAWTPLLVMNRFLSHGLLSIDTYRAFNGKTNLNQDGFVENVLFCSREIGQFPSFVMVDFWESSSVFETVDRVNSLPSFQNNNTRKSF